MLRNLAMKGHVLALTATPIPRTLQNALLGLKQMSVIATPPARRQPIRTLAGVFDEAQVRTALLREKDRGGQSFVVVPRIQDLASLAATLHRLVPQLSLLQAHGDMPAAEIDDAMVRFASGLGDVLLATNIIESGLDVPRANTMLVWRPDRFGLAQLHQLRGRVGRGTAESYCVLVSDAEDETARARLNAIAELRDGFELAERDFELRREGDVLGFVQSGLPGLRVASLTRKDHQALAVRAREHAEALLDARGELDPTRADLQPLAAELRRGWLRRLAAAEPASAT
jgi:transcription-repair coupling factor (superfamily II helicase)